MVAPLVLKQTSHNLVKIPKSSSGVSPPNWDMVNASRGTRSPVKGHYVPVNLYLPASCKSAQALLWPSARPPSHTNMEAAVKGVLVSSKPLRARNTLVHSEGAQASAVSGVKRKAEEPHSVEERTLEQCHDNVNNKRSKAPEGA
ncbi:uncharacterized protein LOC122262541 isoform X1 [Penaeus japonicus]|uniref:uncharacterized protein LOC122262541 isoform X1 n=1 Tax=Penaeus japonicus TaxID=27405 RepID=UPI001C715AF5|nr:uncharacterized protein LOC122262541 isoform X1 [Penaeus japonicus]XP_042886483.1 uncharacterized protein LOC122262541 isoform X1 [Penaeus japonicus]